MGDRGRKPGGSYHWPKSEDRKVVETGVDLAVGLSEEARKELLRDLTRESETGWTPPPVPEVLDSSDLRKRPFKRQKWEVKALQDKHHEVIRRLLIGQEVAGIAREMGMTTAAIQAIKSSPLIQQRLQVLQGARDLVAVDVSKRIKDLAPKAVDLLERIIEGTEEGATVSLRAKVAMDNLDRAGNPRQSYIKSENLHAFLSRDDIEEVKKRAEERRRLVDTAS